MIKVLSYALALTVLLTFAVPAVSAETPPTGGSGTSSSSSNPYSPAGDWRTILQFEQGTGKSIYQYAYVKIRAVSGNRYAATVQVIFGDWGSNEYLAYTYDDINLKTSTGRFNLSKDKTPLTMTGTFRIDKQELRGRWFSNVFARGGEFVAKRGEDPKIPAGGMLVRPLSGYYRGELRNNDPELTQLPGRVTISFTTTLDISGPEPVLKIAGKARLYRGDFGSNEYDEGAFTDIQFNFSNRYLTARAPQLAEGVTFKGYMSETGVFVGTVDSDALGTGVASVKLERYAARAPKASSE